MYPFFHPTSVIVVDDDTEFLKSFAFRFGDNWLCETFDDPDRALNFVKQRDAHRQSLERFLLTSKQVPEFAKREFGEEIFGVKTSHVDSLLGDGGRFGQISVAIIDYGMPRMNGFDLCRALGDLPMRKILLTGKVGREQAVEAFNENLIDCFLEKNNPNLSSVLQGHVARLQNDYFASTTDALSTLHALRDGSFLKDPVFIMMFEKLRRDLKVIEYYTTSYPNGVVLGCDGGEFKFLRICDEEELQSHLEIAHANDAPTELLLRLEERSDLPCFPTENGHYEHSMRNQWKKHLFAAHILHGVNTWRYSVVDCNQLPTGFLNDAVSYHEFRNAVRH